MNKIIDGLYLGNLAGAEDTQQLQQNGVTHVLTAAKGLNPRHMNQFKWKRIEVLDHPEANLYSHFQTAVEFIREGLREGGVYVHCFAGVSRSTSCVIAYLMTELEMTFHEALYFCRARRPIVCPNMGFVRQLQDFEKKIKA